MMAEISVDAAGTSPRAYRSTLREQQAQATRRRVLDAAALEFSRHGYASTTLSGIARVAGVSVETVKGAGSKAELLVGAFETSFSGSEAAPSLTDTEVGTGLLELPDEAFLDGMLAGLTLANSRGFALWTVVLGAALSDDVVKTALDEILARRRADYRMAVQELMRRGVAAASIDVAAAADELSFLLSPEGYQQLVAQSGWAPERYTAWAREHVLAVLAK